MCPLCYSSNYTEIGKPYRNVKSESLIRKDYVIVQCCDCQFYFVYPIIDFTPEEWATLYDSNYFQKLTNWHLKKRSKDRISRVNKLDHYSESKIKNFLDVGCGEGYVLLEALKKGWEAYGLDITENRVDEAKINKINFTKNDLISANYPDNYFDCIYLDSILEHIINPQEYLRELNRILKVGGVIYIGVPNEDSLFNDIKRIKNILNGQSRLSHKIKPFDTPYHVGGFNRNSLKYILNSESFEICELNNFATRAVFLLAEFPSKEFIFNSGLTIIASVAFLIRRENYLEVYAEKEF